MAPCLNVEYQAAAHYHKLILDNTGNILHTEKATYLSYDEIHKDCLSRLLS